MQIQPPVYLVVEDMDSIEPIGYSITFENEARKQYWTVNLTGNRQAFLSDANMKPIAFSTREEAEEFCQFNWPNLKSI